MRKKLIPFLLTLLSIIVITGCGVNKDTPTETAKTFMKGIIDGDVEIIAETYMQEDYYTPEDILSHASSWKLDEMKIEDFTFKAKDKQVHVYYEDSNKEKHTVALELFKEKEGYRITYFKHLNGHEPLEGAKNVSKIKNEKITNQEEYLFPKIDFDAYDEILFEKGNGRVRFIGYTTYYFEDEMEEHAVLAFKYEEDFSTEWENISTQVKTIYSDGSSISDIEKTILSYQDGKDTIVVYDLGEVNDKEKKLVRMDYSLGHDEELDWKTLSLKSTKKIKLLGLKKLPNPLLKDAPYVMKNKNKEVSISSITYNDESKVLKVQGEVTFNEDFSYLSEYGYLYIPSHQKTYESSLDTENSSFYKGIGSAFNATFELDKNLFKQDKPISLFLYGLGLTIDLSNGEASEKGNPSVFINSYPHDGDIKISDYNGLIDVNGNIHHNAISIKHEYGRQNHLKYQDHLYTFNPFLTGNMYKKGVLNIAFGQIDGIPGSTASVKISFYSYQNPIEWGNGITSINGDFPKELVAAFAPDYNAKVTAPKLKLIKSVTFGAGEVEKKDIEIDLKGVEFLGVFVESQGENDARKSIIIDNIRLD